MSGGAVLAVAKILFGWGFTAAAAFAAGRWFLRLAGTWDSLSRLERLVFGFGLGAACLSNVVFLLCAAQLAYPAAFLAAGGALVLLGLRGRAAPAVEQEGLAGLGRLRWLLAAVAAAYGGLYLIHALAPETSPDGAGYHLELVSRYMREHGFSRITTNMYAAMSQGTEMLFTFAFAFGGNSAPKLVHLTFLAATVGALVSFGARFGVAPAAVAAAFYACAPVVGVTAAASYNDCALAFYIFLTFYLLLLWSQQGRDGRLLLPVGVAAGFCYAIKYTGFLAVPFALAWMMRESRPWLPAALRVGAAASLFVVPWMAKNAVLLQNPVAPFFNSWFPNPHFHVSTERAYHYLRRHYNELGTESWIDYLQMPAEVTEIGRASCRERV